MITKKGQDQQSEHRHVSATLRLVKLLVKYAVELRNDLEPGLRQTPTQPWKDIIPQLFCRLNHPEPYARQAVSDLLCRVAKDLPHLIIFPAVVGSQDGPTRIENMHTKQDTAGLLSQEAPVEAGTEEDEVGNQEGAEQEATSVGLGPEEEDESADEGETEEKKVELKKTYKYLLDALVGSEPRRIEEVKLFVGEMRRITLLREELWIGALNQIRESGWVDSALDVRLT